MSLWKRTQIKAPRAVHEARAAALEDALAAAIEGDRDSILRTLGALKNNEQMPWHLPVFVAASALWMSAGGGIASRKRRAKIAASLRRPGSPWAEVLDPGVLELHLEMISGIRRGDRRFPPEQALPALVAIAAHCLSHPDARRSTWATEYQYHVKQFRRRERGMVKEYLRLEQAVQEFRRREAETARP
jgi:hypothetical protein